MTTSGEQAGTAPHKEDVGRGGGDHLDFQDDQVLSEEHVQVFKCFKKRFKDCAINWHVLWRPWKGGFWETVWWVDKDLRCEYIKDSVG